MGSRRSTLLEGLTGEGQGSELLARTRALPAPVEQFPLYNMPRGQPGDDNPYGSVVAPPQGPGCLRSGSLPDLHGPLAPFLRGNQAQGQSLSQSAR